ncbi:hypothetical protein ACFWFX_14405 [Streptomyces roseolus]|uniref:hypothetical protein n=1 Tax=Streptomyces roseolus TaxID=67358 RepID=UPI00365FF3A2
MDLDPVETHFPGATRGHRVPRHGDVDLLLRLPRPTPMPVGPLRRPVCSRRPAAGLRFFSTNPKHSRENSSLIIIPVSSSISIV